ncbi:MAG: PepSY-associated TM helix domain-containing protein [Kordiimonas sp.]
MYRDAKDIADHTGTALSGDKSKKRRGKSKPIAQKTGFWKKQARVWHWVSGAVCLAGMLLFSLTGITLNHASKITAEPRVIETRLELPTNLLQMLEKEPTDGYTRHLPTDIRNWIDDQLDVSVTGKRVEWTEIDAYVALERPGGEAWLTIDRETGEVIHELTTRGTIALLNDLHKGRDTGPAWIWFIDIFSVASVIFCLTGLWLLQIHAAKRPSTWPLTVIGFLIPMILAVISRH